MLIWYEVIYWISFSSYLLPIIVFIPKKGIFKTEDNLSSVLLFYQIICISTELFNIFYMQFFRNNNPVIHIYTIVIFVLVSFFYFKIFKNFNYKKLLFPMTIFFIIYSFYEFFNNQGYLNVNTKPYLILTIYTIILSSIYFYKVYSEMKIANLFQDGLFWVNSAFLIYFSSTFYVSLFEEYIRSEDSNLLYYTWPIQLVSTIIFNVILSRGIWLMRKQ